MHSEGFMFWPTSLVAKKLRFSLVNIYIYIFTLIHHIQVA